MAWQISRAVARVHGVTVPIDTLKARYLDVDSAGDVVVRGDSGLSLVADGLVSARGAIGPVLPLLLGPVVVGALLTIGIIFRLCGPGTTRRRVLAVSWSAMGVLLALHMGGYFMLMSHAVQDWMIGGLVRGLAGRLANWGAVGWVGAWLIWIALAVVGWRFCAGALQRVEAVRQRPGSTSVH